MLSTNINTKEQRKKIVAGAHTLNELVKYALNKYDLVEINVAERKCIEQRINLSHPAGTGRSGTAAGARRGTPKGC